MSKTLAIIQARMSSSRLPGKVLLDIAGQPMLVRVIERTLRARSLDGIVVATTLDPSDDPIEHMCAERGYPCYRGNLQDVLDRYYQAARAFGAEVIVRITGDCPVMDPAIIDATVQIFYQESASGFAATRLPPPWRRTIPIGLDVEIVHFASLERAWKEATQPFHREHVMPFFYEGTPSDDMQPADVLPGQENWSVAHGVSLRGFKIAVLNHDPDYGNLRWTVDTQEDLVLLRAIFEHFAGGGADDALWNDGGYFSWQEILALVKRQPDLGKINANVRHKDFRESESAETQNHVETQNLASLSGNDHD
jgi:spore coat polysaccharide biosynthesis protein SpsF